MAVMAHSESKACDPFGIHIINVCLIEKGQKT